MKIKSMLAAAIYAVGLSELFNQSIFARQRRNVDPFSKHRRIHKAPDWAFCHQCNKAVSRNGEHRCLAPYIAAPRHGWRFERGKLVRRSAS